jgi:malonyl-CoA O-methyltransferase
MDIKQGIRRNFARRAASYERYAGVQRLMAEELLGLAGPALAEAGAVLEVGCGTGFLTGGLRRANPQARLVALDLDAALVERARQRLGPDPRTSWLVADGETLGRGRFDLIISNAVFQWFTDPEATLKTYWQTLSPRGRLAFSTLGPRTFRELAASVRQAVQALKLTAAPEIPAANFLGPENWQALLTRAGFSRVQVAEKTISVGFPSVGQFLKALQATGATNPRPRPLTPRFLKVLDAAYQSTFRQNGSIPVTYEIIWVVACK